MKLGISIKGGKRGCGNMCVMSMIMDHYHDKWCENWHKDLMEEVERQRGIISHPGPEKRDGSQTITPFPLPIPSQEEIKEFRDILEKAREYDKKNNQPDCELEEKKKKLLDLAKEMGIEINFL